MDAELYVRQVLVHEVGLHGQRAISRASADVRGPTLAHEVATRYASAAGFGGLEDATAPFAITEIDESLSSAAAREVLIGARAALRAIVAALPPPPSAEGAPPPSAEEGALPLSQEAAPSSRTEEEA